MLSCFSHLQLFVTLWTAVHQASLSMEFSRQKYWSGLPFPILGYLPNPGMEPMSLMSPALAGGLFTTNTTWCFKPVIHHPSNSDSAVQSLSGAWLFATPWTAAHQASLSITNSQTLLKLMSIVLVMPSNHLTLHCPFYARLQFFPTSGTFPVSQFFASGGQSIGVSASASVLSMNIQDWFPLGWIGWISSQSKGLSRVFSNTTVQKHQFFSAQLSL